MFELKDLFDSREIVGSKLEQMIQKRGNTKKEVCTGAGISRPTLDKLLDGEITNKTNFEKHMGKLLAYLSLSPNELMGGIENPFTDMKHLRKALNIDLPELSKISGASIEDLKRIEAGEDMPLLKLRDIALCLGTSVMGILGEGYFQTQVATMDDLVRDRSVTIRSPGGFWGHLGVLLCGQPKYMWFPITNFTRQTIYQNSAQKYIAIPCMDNSLLLINCKMVEELTLLDDACDQPVDMDWDYKVSCGEIPNVIYEAFDDYMFYKSGTNAEECDLSENFIKVIDRFVDENKIDIEKFEAELSTATIIFSSGRIQKHMLMDGCSDELDTAVQQIYETGEWFGEEMMELENMDGGKTLINLKNAAMIKLPLAKTESKIHEAFLEIKKDLQ